MDNFVKKYLSTEVKNQHYVPQFILKNFCVDKKLQLFALNKNDGNSFPTHIRNIASENGFYNFDYKDERLSIEYPLAQLEDVISKIIYKIIAEESLASTTDNDKQILSFFLSVQKIRGNSTRETLKEMNQLLMKHLMDMGADPSKVEGFQNLEEDDVKKISIEMVLDADRFAPYFYDKTWLLYRTEESLPFIISDTPITLQNSNDFGFFGNLGLNVPGIEIYFPLSPTLTLAIVCNSLEGSFRDAQKKYDFITNYDPKLLEDFNLDSNHCERFVKAMDFGVPFDISVESLLNVNALQVIQSSMFIYSIIDDFSFVKEMIAQEPRYKSHLKIVVG